MLERKLIEVRLPNDMMCTEDTTTTTTTTNSKPKSNTFTACLPRHLYPLLQKCSVSLPVYLTYAHLRNSTFVVLRHGARHHATKNKARSGKAGASIEDDDCLSLPPPPPLVVAAARAGERFDVVGAYASLEGLEGGPEGEAEASTYLSWDVYAPSSSFKKSSPGPPLFSTCVTPFDSTLARGAAGRPGSGVGFDFVRGLAGEGGVKVCAVTDSGTVMVYDFKR